MTLLCVILERRSEEEHFGRFGPFSKQIFRGEIAWPVRTVLA
jgi:hypothetical protein